MLNVWRLTRSHSSHNKNQPQNPIALGGEISGDVKNGNQSGGWPSRFQ